MAEDKPPAVGGDNITPGEDSTIAQMLAKAGKTLLMSFPKTFFRHSYIEQMILVLGQIDCLMVHYARLLGDARLLGGQM